MGQITAGLLDAMRIPHRAFPELADDVEPALDAAEAAMARSGLPFALVMARDTVRDDGLDGSPPAQAARGPARLPRSRAPPARARCWSASWPRAGAAAVVATTGKCGRELFTLADRPQHLYQVGSMGCASAMGLGVALNTARPVVVLDGDGAALMKLGNFATIGRLRPGQPGARRARQRGARLDGRAGHGVAERGLRRGRAGLRLRERRELRQPRAASSGRWRRRRGEPGPHLVHVRIAPGSLAKLGRPTIKPPEVARRFRAFLAGPS